MSALVVGSRWRDLLALGSFQKERQRATRFVCELRLSLHTFVSTFKCVTLQEAVARALDGELAYTICHTRETLGQSL